MGGKKETKQEQRIELPREVQESLDRMSGKAEDIFDIQSDFFKSVMLPYQRSLMETNQQLLPLVSEAMRSQLQIQSADLMGEADIREQLREEATKDIGRAAELGADLFEQLKQRTDVDALTGRRRAQIKQEFGRLERNLIREGLDPTSPEARAIKKELELEEAKASVQARTGAEQEAFQALAGGLGTFQQKGLQDIQAGQTGSLAVGDPRARQLGVTADTGLAALQEARAGQGILSRQTTTTAKTTSPGVSIGDVVGGIATGVAAGAAGGFGGTAANIAIKELTGRMGNRETNLPHIPAV